MKATVWSYDVWGNEKDGFDVNDRSCFARDIDCPEKILGSDRELLKWLKDIGFIVKGIRLASLRFDGDDTSIVIEQANNGYPFGVVEIGNE